MDNNELGVAFAAMRLAELHHQVDQRRQAGRLPTGSAAGAGTGRQGGRAAWTDTARLLTTQAAAAPSRWPLPATPSEQPWR
jgi:hypothetical protein